MTRLPSIVDYLDSLLTPRNYRGDIAYNGLQVESGADSVSCVAFAVDAGLSIIEQAISQEAGLLIVHHGLMWGGQQPATGTYGTKLRKLMRAGCSLYASHLPLDGHREVGNGFELARFLNLEECREFCEYEGATIGAAGKVAKPQTIEYFVELARQIEGAVEPLVLPFGPEKITSVGVVTGSGSSALGAAKAAGLDLLISGEPKHEAYHLAKELEMNALFLGHYGSETFGVKALQRRLEKDFDISTVFIHEPTGI